MELLGGAVVPPDFAARLHVEPMSEAEIAAALAETLPVGWSAVRHEDSENGLTVYYWNQETDQTTWLKPIAAAEESAVAAAQKLQDTEAKWDEFLSSDQSASAAKGEARPDYEKPEQIEEAKKELKEFYQGQKFEQFIKKEKSEKILLAPNAAAGGALQFHWPPKPEEMREKNKPAPTLAGGGRKSLFANRVLRRVGDVSARTPPPAPKTTKQRIMAFHTANNEDFDEEQWQFRKGKWTHLPPPPLPEKELVVLRRMKKEGVPGKPITTMSGGGKQQQGKAAAAGALAAGSSTDSGMGHLEAGTSASAEEEESGEQPVDKPGLDKFASNIFKTFVV